jgi:hypothetical protein
MEKGFGLLAVNSVVRIVCLMVSNFPSDQLLNGLAHLFESI